MRVRPIVAADHAVVDGIVRAAFLAAFGRADEPALVAHLRALDAVVLELVAEEAGAIVGHILFSRAVIDAGGRKHPALQLAPVCAAPGQQRRGVGGALIRAGLDWLAAQEESHVFVLGDPAYYARFGFSAAAAEPYASPWPGPHFMLRRLHDAGPDGGRLIVSPAFG
ncbi:MAG: N-acetyltransferase [Hyphomonadaceae bacterium]|nr:N-acetyltransferase [Hyphomonadaceae bacterium]